MLSLLEERADNKTSHHLSEEGELNWEMILKLGAKSAAVGPSFSQTSLAAPQSACRHVVQVNANSEAWRQKLKAPQSADLILVDHAVWDNAEFVQEGLAQLCNVLSYGGHFLWTGGPGFWPRRAQTRAAILRLCSLHGLRLVRQLKVKAAGEGKPAMRGWLLERRNPIRTLVHG